MEVEDHSLYTFLLSFQRSVHHSLCRSRHRKGKVVVGTARYKSRSYNGLDAICILLDGVLIEVDVGCEIRYVFEGSLAEGFFDD